eukprot:6208387-Pleurochrysis_carterae.AAC.1
MPTNTTGIAPLWLQIVLSSQYHNGTCKRQTSEAYERRSAKKQVYQDSRAGAITCYKLLCPDLFGGGLMCMHVRLLKAHAPVVRAVFCMRVHSLLLARVDIGE